MRFKTNYNLHEFAKPVGEINTQVSLTIPDQVMSTREIMDRYARGLPLGMGKIPIYTEEEDYENPLATMDFEHMDLAEKEQVMKQIKKQRDEYKARYDQAVEEEKLNKAKKVLEMVPTDVEDEYEAQEGQYPDPKAKLPTEGQKAKKRQKNDA